MPNCHCYDFYPHDQTCLICAVKHVGQRPTYPHELRHGACKDNNTECMKANEVASPHWHIYSFVLRSSNEYTNTLMNVSPQAKWQADLNWESVRWADGFGRSVRGLWDWPITHQLVCVSEHYHASQTHWQRTQNETGKKSVFRKYVDSFFTSVWLKFLFPSWLYWSSGGGKVEQQTEIFTVSTEFYLGLLIVLRLNSSL